MDYGNVYVASVAMGANDNQTVQAFAEAESYDGPSLIIAYSHCIAHGFDMKSGLSHQQAAVNSGHWILYRYDPRRAAKNLNPLQMDSRSPIQSVYSFAETENRFQRLIAADSVRANALLSDAQTQVTRRYEAYTRRAESQVNGRVVPPDTATK